MIRFFLQSFLVFALNLGLSSAGRTAEITGFRVVSPGQVEITFASNAGVHYDVLGSEDLYPSHSGARGPGTDPGCCEGASRAGRPPLFSDPHSAAPSNPRMVSCTRGVR